MTALFGNPEIFPADVPASPYTEQDGRAHVAGAVDRLASGQTAESGR